MMNIISYKKLRGSVYKINLDNGDEFKLHDDVILKYELLIDKKVDADKLKRILEDNAEYDAYFKAIKYIGIKMRTELELRKYLKKCEFTSKTIDNIITKIKEMGYLDEEKYVHAFINDAINLGMSGPKKIKEQLGKLGITSKYVDEQLDSIDSDIWIEKIKKIIDKKSKTNRFGEALFKSKMYSYLILNGYYPEDIRTVLEDFKSNNPNIFLKEATKIYDKLSSRYSGKELELKFKSKMFMKGFASEDINNFLEQK